LAKIIFTFSRSKTWAKNAAVIVVVISRKNFEFNEKPAITHQFDACAAWENLALEATSRELVTLGMQGFDFNEARKVLGIPDSFDVMAMIAIGKLGQKENLPRDLQERDYLSNRKPLEEIVMEGKFIGRSIQ
jgi:nitroreductase